MQQILNILLHMFMLFNMNLVSMAGQLETLEWYAVCDDHVFFFSVSPVNACVPVFMFTCNCEHFVTPNKTKCECKVKPLDTKETIIW